MSTSTPRWSGEPGRTRPRRPRSIAPPEARRALAGEDAALVERAVEHALARIRASLRRHGIAAALLFDPVNIRYATGTSIMPIWTLHAIDRYLLVPAEGEPILWECAQAPSDFVSPYPPLETRTATNWSVFGSGERAVGRAGLFAAEVARVLRERGIRDELIGVDRLDGYGFLALQAAGLRLVPAQLPIEQARSVKGPAELELIRRSLRVCEAAVIGLREALRPVMTEN